VAKLSESEKQRIAGALSQRRANRPCPRCGNEHFSLLDGYSIQVLQQDFKSIVIGGGPIVPAVGVACNNCGFIAFHALGALDLLPDRQEE